MKIEKDKEGDFILTVFQEVKQKQIELEYLRILAKASEITYRQKGEIYTAERLAILNDRLTAVVSLLDECNDIKVSIDDHASNVF